MHGPRRLAAAFLALGLGLPCAAGAAPMSLLDELVFDIQQATGPTVEPLYASGIEPPRASHSGTVAFGGAEPEPGLPRGVIAFFGPLGVAIDYSGPVPRVEGIAFSPSEGLSIIAAGSMDSDVGLEGRLIVRFPFR